MVDGIAGPETEKALIAAKAQKISPEREISLVGNALAASYNYPLHEPAEVGEELVYRQGQSPMFYEAKRAKALWCVNPSYPRILHCFPAHRTEIRDFHHDQLDRIAIRIAESFHDGRPIRSVHMIGHAATWKGISRAEYHRRGLQRAENAKRALMDRLIPVGLGSKVVITIESRANNDPLSGVDNSTQNNRALNRRVEIRLARARPAKKKTCRSPEIVESIRKAQISNLTNILHERKQLSCLRKFIADALRGNDADDRFWTFTVVDGGTLGSGHAVTRNKKMRRAVQVYCRFLRGRKLNAVNLSKALWKTHHDILGEMEKLHRFISGIPRGTLGTGDPVKDYTECKYVRQITALARSTRNNSVYRCYRNFIDPKFSRCKQDK